MKEKIKTNIKKILGFILNPKLLLCVGLAWMITNGWSYIMFGLGTYFQISWMIVVSSSYIAFLWLPISPEKLATFTIAIGLLKLLFPNDTRTLAVLRRFYRKARNLFFRLLRKIKHKILYYFNKLKHKPTKTAKK